MDKEINYKINPSEGLYFGIKVMVSILIYALLFYLLMSGTLFENMFKIMIALFYVGMIGLLLIFRMGVIVGYLKGNSIRISENQFPDIYEIVVAQSKLLGIDKIPNVYLLEAGVLNAFALRFMGKNYVVLFSDILEEAYEDNIESVEFIIGHELGHIKRKHITKSLLFFPSIIVPFLNQAYSRACEYTCDSIGAELSPKGAVNGLVLLSSGSKLFRKVNVENFIAQGRKEGGFWAWFTEKLSSHPRLTKRIDAVNGKEVVIEYQKLNELIMKEPIKQDHDKYLPTL